MRLVSGSGSSTPLEVRRGVLRSLRRLLPRMHLAGFSSTVLQPLMKVREGTQPCGLTGGGVCVQGGGGRKHAASRGVRGGLAGGGQDLTCLPRGLENVFKFVAVADGNKAGVSLVALRRCSCQDFVILYNVFVL